MIQVTITRNASDRSIRSYVVEGHAEFDEPGKDIVCAGVSAVTVGTVNSVESLLGVVLMHDVEHGFMEIIVPDHLESGVSEKVQLLLESMVVMLQSIEQSYGEYIAIKTLFKEGGRLTCCN